jgi:hypothetical protein
MNFTITPSLANQLELLRVLFVELSGTPYVSYAGNAADIQRNDDLPYIEIELKQGVITSVQPEIIETVDISFPQTTEVNLSYTLVCVVNIYARVVEFFTPIELALGLISSLSSPEIALLLKDNNIIISGLNENNTGDSFFEINSIPWDNRNEWVVSFNLSLAMLSTIGAPKLDGHWIDHALVSLHSTELSAGLLLVDSAMPPIEGD